MQKVFIWLRPRGVLNMAIPAVVVGVGNFNKRITDGRSVSFRSVLLPRWAFITTGTTGGDAGHVPLMGHMT